MMIDEWLRPVEQVMLSSPIRGARTIGFVAPSPGAGVSTLCRMAAELTGRSGSRTLLVDLSAPLDTEHAEAPWSDTTTTVSGFDVVRSIGGRTTALRFNRSDWFRDVLIRHFAGHDKIIVDLPPLLAAERDHINPAAAAAACDVVVLLAPRGSLSPAEVEDAADLLRSAGANIAGTVLNDFKGARRVA
jgi:Mrp family chromosome partitioning ATPase